MSSDELVEQAIALIGKRAQVRSPAIAAALDVTVENVHELLHRLVESGELVACAVQSAEHGSVMEYRASLAGGGKNVYFTQMQQPAARAPRRESAAPVTSAQEKPEEPTMATSTSRQTIKDRIVAAFRKHGPMTTRQLGEHVDYEDRSILCAQLAGRGVLGRLGGKSGNTIYGLPDQHAPAADPPPRSIHRNPAGGGRVAMRKRRVKRVPKIAKAQAATRKAPAQPNGAFRPAIASDGALLFIGAAKGDFELNRDETRALAEFLRRVDRTGARA